MINDDIKAVFGNLAVAITPKPATEFLDAAPPVEDATPAEALGTEYDAERAEPTSADLTTTWVNRTRNVARPSKQALARYFVSHHVNYGDGIMPGSGSTLNAVMDELIQFQIDNNDPYDLKICSPNMQIIQKGRLAKASYKDLFTNTQLNMTGGSVLSALESLAGDFAVATINSDLFYPDIILFGAAGVTFDCQNVRVTYQWQDELGVQTALATRPTDHRILIFDHTKFGRTSGWKADITVESMMAKAKQCSIISTVPDEFDPARETIRRQVESFRSILNRLADQRSQDHQELKLILVDRDARLVLELSLSEVCKEKANAQKAKPTSSNGQRNATELSLARTR